MSKEQNHLRLYLMRHGEVESAAQGKRLGHWDVALSPRGEAQSRWLAAQLANRKIAAVCSSDLQRAHFAAREIAARHHLTVRQFQEFREVNAGEWEGMALTEINQVFPETIAQLFTDPGTFRYPGGESFAELFERVDRTLQKILAQYQDNDAAAGKEIALVAHGGVTRVILGSVLELPSRRWLSLAQDYGCLNIIEWHDGRVIVKLLNQTMPE